MKRAALFGGIAILASWITACHSDKPAEGPAEKAGEKVDEAAEKTKDTAKDAADATKETAKDAKDNVKEKTDK